MVIQYCSDAERIGPTASTESVQRPDRGLVSAGRSEGGSNDKRSVLTVTDRVRIACTDDDRLARQ
jgi:hypothetical protein